MRVTAGAAWPPPADQEYGQLVAADPGHEVATAQCPLEEIGDPLEECLPVRPTASRSGLDLEEDEAEVEPRPVRHPQEVAPHDLQGGQAAEPAQGIDVARSPLLEEASVVFEDQADQPHQGGHGEGALHHVLVGALADRLESHLHVVSVGDRDERDVRGRPLEEADRARALAVGEVEVGEDEVDPVPNEPGQGGAQPGHRVDLEVLGLLQEAADEAGEEVVVVDEEHPDLAVARGRAQARSLARQVDDPEPRRRRAGPAAPGRFFQAHHDLTQAEEASLEPERLPPCCPIVGDGTEEALSRS